VAAAKKKASKGKKAAAPEQAAAVAEAPQPATTPETTAPEPSVAELPKDGPAVEPQPESPADVKVDVGAVQENTGEESATPEVETTTTVEPDTVPAPKTEKEDPEEKEEKKGKKGKSKTDAAEEEFLAVVGQLKERYGGAVELLKNIPIDGTPTMSTGNFGLDVATFGGLRRGRLYRFWGRPKSAKTGSALNVVEQFTSNHCAECFEHRLKCKCKGDFVYAKALYVDVEGRVSDNQPWALKHGIHPDRLIFVSPKGGEMVVDVADAVLRSNVGIGLIVIDSIAQITPQAEVLKAAEKGITIGRAAQLINSAMRKWVCSIVSKDIAASNKPTVILINQIRNKTDGMGSPDVMPGGLGQGYVSACDIKFTQKAAHYIKKNAKGQWEDKTTSFDGTGFRPGPDDAPNYFEIDYKVTDSGICPPRRFGTFNYWLRAGHGRRVGDVDNTTRVWEYVTAYKLMQALKVGYKLDNLEAKTQRELKAAFLADPDVQERVWNTLVERLKEPDTIETTG
jgi:RecA/RadA recombinase